MKGAVAFGYALCASLRITGQGQRERCLLIVIYRFHAVLVYPPGGENEVTKLQMFGNLDV
jgi:hypothetical protein